ncbi:Hypp9363 [Branchiostoma lanceolatum]|uniref:Hypp9363 protein n=1 Tax=Branchiostoma lanceolatum TaxID=7740 RepID=A0A8S4MLV6_BRALA|nr:Hypp9363 [Branchiostoma lanceolatum]
MSEPAFRQHMVGKQLDFEMGDRLTCKRGTTTVGKVDGENMWIFNNEVHMLAREDERGVIVIEELSQKDQKYALLPTQGTIWTATITTPLSLGPMRHAVVVVGPSGLGKTMSLKTALSMIGIGDTGYLRQFKREAMMSLASQTTLGCFLDDPLSLESCKESVIDFYGMGTFFTLSRGFEAARCGYLMTANNPLQHHTESLGICGGCEGFCKMIQDRFDRRRKGQNTYEDITDGRQYKKIKELREPNNMSLLMNTDGRHDEVLRKHLPFVDLYITETKKSLRCKLDTGAHVNVLPEKDWRRLRGRNTALKPTETRLYGYGNTWLDVLGECSLPCRHRENTRRKKSKMEIMGDLRKGPTNLLEEELALQMKLQAQQHSHELAMLKELLGAFTRSQGLHQDQCSGTGGGGGVVPPRTRQRRLSCGVRGTPPPTLEREQVAASSTAPSQGQLEDQGELPLLM